MAIVRQTDQPSDDQLSLSINNGDLAALRAIRDRFDLRDEEAVLRFALAILTKSVGNTIYVEDESGTKVGLSPSNALRRETQDGETNQQ